MRSFNGQVSSQTCPCKHAFNKDVHQTRKANQRNQFGSSALPVTYVQKTLTLRAQAGKRKKSPNPRKQIPKSANPSKFLARPRPKARTLRESIPKARTLLKFWPGSTRNSKLFANFHQKREACAQNPDFCRFCLMPLAFENCEPFAPKPENAKKCEPFQTNVQKCEPSRVFGKALPKSANPLQISTEIANPWLRLASICPKVRTLSSKCPKARTLCLRPQSIPACNPKNANPSVPDTGSPPVAAKVCAKSRTLCGQARKSPNPCDKNTSKCKKRLK